MANSQWLILQLNDYNNSIDYDEIENSVIDLFGNKAEYFIPIRKEKIGSYTSTCTLMDGYVFVKDSSSARSSLIDIDDYKVFSGVLESGGRACTVNSREIGVMKRRLSSLGKRKIPTGKSVRVLDGVFSNLVGEVMGHTGDNKIVVRIKRPSREMIVPLPVTSVAEVE